MVLPSTSAGFRNGPIDFEAISTRSSVQITAVSSPGRFTDTAITAPSRRWRNVSSIRLGQVPVFNCKSTCGNCAWYLANSRGSRPVAEDSIAPIRSVPDGDEAGSTALLASTTSPRIFSAYARNTSPAGVIHRPRPSLWNNGVPSSCSNALIRAVTFDGTQQDFSAARATLPVSATALNIRIWPSSIIHN